MYARDASGRNVSLLNEPMQPIRAPSSSRGSSAEAPYTPPELQQTESYDSSPRSAPISPSTPTMPSYDHYRPAYDYRTYMYAGATQPAYDEYVSRHVSRKHGSLSDSARSGSYDDDAAPAGGHPAPERAAKRYPCRFRDSHGCDKTFTTSGHASRHSKIHTAEKAVQCTFTGCQKKFTRADNMKQHLETHYKDKSRKASSSGSSSRRSGHHHSSRSSTQRARAPPSLDVGGGGYGPLTPVAAPLVSPATGAWDLRGLNVPLMTAHGGNPAPRTGLDALAMAAAHQEDS